MKAHFTSTTHVVARIPGGVDKVGYCRLYQHPLFYHSVLKPRHLNKGFADKHLKIEEGIAYLPLYETSLLWWCIFPLFFVIH